MGRPNTQRIGAILPAVLSRAREQHGALFAIQRRWGRLVGRALAAHTKPIGLRRGRLVVCAARPGDGFLLSYRRARLLERLQEMVRERVEEIVIRPGDPTENTPRAAQRSVRSAGRKPAPSGCRI